MFDIFQMNIPLLASSIVLVAMGCIALLFSLILRQKSRALNSLPKNLSANVFDKTFNVFEPDEQHRKIISSHTGLIIFVAVYGSWLAAMIAVFKTFEAGGILACVTFLICAGLLLIDETQEINKNAGIFLKALRNGAGLGKGDLQALSVIRKASSKLTRYHMILATLFFASAATIPSLVNTALLATAEIAAAALAISSALTAVPMLALLVLACLFATALMVIQVGGNKIRKRVFDFPPSIPVDVVGRQFHRMKMYVGILHHHPTLREPKPEETENVNKKELEERTNY